SVRHIFKPISYLEIQLLSGVSGGYITCTEKNLVKLTQDLYPIDATPDNIRKLSTDRDALNELHIDGMVLFITGPAL
ncbi:hypothetical protein ACTHI7_26785, partial [Citrobacter freundii]